MTADKADHKAVEAKADQAGKLDLNRLQLDMDMRMLGKQALPVKADLPAAFAGKSGDLTLVDDNIAKAMEFARSRMTPEQIARAEHDAASPKRWIEAAAKIDESRATKHDVTSKHNLADKVEVTAKPGDTYWGVAHSIVSERQGHAASPRQAREMLHDLAVHNGKTDEDAAHLKVGEIIKIPPIKHASA